MNQTLWQMIVHLVWLQAVSDLVRFGIRIGRPHWRPQFDLGGDCDVVHQWGLERWTGFWLYPSDTYAQRLGRDWSGQGRGVVPSFRSCTDTS